MRKLLRLNLGCRLNKTDGYVNVNKIDYCKNLMVCCANVPEKRSMNTGDEEEITMIQNKFNNRLRKRHGFKTPSDVFHQSLKRVALRT
jgi:hypothetical protein